MAARSSVFPSHLPLSRVALLSVLAAVACSAPDAASPPEHPARASQAGTGDLSWKGYDWNITTGGMAGVAQGDPSNVVVDANGYLHLKITKNGATWTAAELFSTTNLGFGTYQWQVAGPIDRMDHNVVLGLSPYGPAAGVGADGYNEIDTEFSYWNDEIGHVNMDWGVYPATKAGTHHETDFFFSLSGGNETTARMVWSKTGVVSTVFSGFVPLGSNPTPLSTNEYKPANPTDNIPQEALPVLLNLWCYKAVPASGTLVEVVLQDFQFVAEGQPIPEADASTEAGPEDAGGAAQDAEAVDAEASDTGSGKETGGGGTAHPDAAAAGGGGADTGSGGGCDVGRPSGPHARTATSVSIAALAALLALGVARRRKASVTAP